MALSERQFARGVGELPFAPTAVRPYRRSPLQATGELLRRFASRNDNSYKVSRQLLCDKGSPWPLVFRRDD